MLERFALGNYLPLVDCTGRRFRDGQALISAELSGMLERIGRTAESSGARLEETQQVPRDSSPPAEYACARWPLDWECTSRNWADAQGGKVS